MSVWRDIPGWEGLYAVSNDGQVRSLPRRRRPYERLLSPARERLHPYLYVTLWRGKTAHHRRVHRLVLEAFVGPRPPGQCGLHADDDPDNNDLANLRWGTRSDNGHDMVRNGNHNHARKTHCKWGHELVGANVRLTSKQRVCLACNRRRNTEYQTRRALAVYVADISETREGAA